MTDQEKADRLKKELIDAQKIITTMIELADKEGFNVQMTSTLVNGKFETKIDIAKRL